MRFSSGRLAGSHGKSARLPEIPLNVRGVRSDNPIAEPQTRATTLEGGPRALVAFELRSRRRGLDMPVRARLGPSERDSMTDGRFEPRITRDTVHLVLVLRRGRRGPAAHRSTRPTSRWFACMCSGRVDPTFVVSTRSRAAWTACSSAAAIPATATTSTATARPLARFQVMTAMLGHLGIEPERRAPRVGHRPPRAPATPSSSPR